MEHITTISDQKPPTDESRLTLRHAARAILFDKENLIPLLYVAKHDYHKLPGGGIDEGENKEQALVRECHEEVGAEIEVTGEVGMITEYRLKWDFKQFSYCYLGKIITKGEPHFTDSEKERGFQVVWLPLTAAIATIGKEAPSDYAGAIIQQRDLAFLKRAAEILRNNT